MNDDTHLEIGVNHLEKSRVPIKIEIVFIFKTYQGISACSEGNSFHTSMIQYNGQPIICILVVS